MDIIMSQQPKKVGIVIITVGWSAAKRISDMVGESHEKTRRVPLMLGGHFSVDYPSLNVRHHFVWYFGSS